MFWMVIAPQSPLRLIWNIDCFLAFSYPVQHYYAVRPPILPHDFVSFTAFKGPSGRLIDNRVGPPCRKLIHPVDFLLCGPVNSVFGQVELDNLSHGQTPFLILSEDIGPFFLGGERNSWQDFSLLPQCLLWQSLLFAGQAGKKMTPAVQTEVISPRPRGWAVMADFIAVLTRVWGR
uniref:Uncharacterized protein n=1 Tax=Desulfobacca acetoxidans TaxID=60893 RepID=A0A7V6A6A0_9BACT